MEEFTVINKDKPLQTNQSVVQGFTTNGIKIDPEDKQSFAKKVVHVDTGLTQFFIKRDRFGFYNPWGLYSENIHNSIVDRHQLSYQKVTETAFNFYLQFLETKSEGLLRRAERSNNE